MLVDDGTAAEELAAALRDAGIEAERRSGASDSPSRPGGVRGLAAEILAFERLLESRRPDAILLASDGDPAVAAAIVATKLRVPVATFADRDRAGLEGEVNRTLLRALADARLADDPQAAVSWVTGT